MSKKELPFRVDPPNLRWVDKQDIYAEGKDNCDNCKYFSCSPMSSPGGWCQKHPCKQANCGVGQICDDWESKKEINVYEKIRALEDELKELRKMADSAHSKKKRLSDFTWGEIAEIAKGHPEEVFDIGDEKEIPLSSGEVLTAVIVGFKHDNLATVHGVAGITFGLKGIPDGWFEMNTDCTNVGGWKDCKMRNVYMQRFYNLFPEELKDLIVTIVKRTGNNVKNLEWCTSSYNQNHSVATGLRKVRLTASDKGKVVQLRNSGLSQTAIAKMIGVSQMSVSLVLRNKIRHLEG